MRSSAFFQLARQPYAATRTLTSNMLSAPARTQFVRDSWRLMKRCTKPDRTGAPAVIFAQSEFCAAVLRLAALFYSIISFAELSSLPLCCLSLSRRVLEDRAGDRHRLCDHGLHRLLREAHLHPDQQHHRCARSSSSKSYTATLSTNCVCSLSRCRALQSAWAEVVLLSRCMEERMDRMRGGGSLAAGFYEETRERALQLRFFDVFYASYLPAQARCLERLFPGPFRRRCG